MMIPFYSSRAASHASVAQFAVTWRGIDTPADANLTDTAVSGYARTGSTGQVTIACSSRPAPLAKRPTYTRVRNRRVSIRALMMRPSGMASRTAGSESR
jgi:hypothetical protein